MSEVQKGGLITDILSGAGLGLLIGITVGMSATPVVAGVIGTLTSLLAVFLGLGGNVEGSKLLSQINTTRIAALGFAMVAGLLIGLYVRINNPLSEDPEQAMSRWTQALPEDPTLAKQMMIYERTGISPGALTFGTETPKEPVETKVETSAASKSAVLFSALSDYNACSRLDPEEFKTPEKSLKRYDDSNAPAYFPKIREWLESIPDGQREMSIKTAYEVLCTIQRNED